jgi:hypothetical protein
LIEEVVATAGAIRGIEEPPEFVLTDDEEDIYEVGVYFGTAATIYALQDLGWLPAPRAHGSP